MARDKRVMGQELSEEKAILLAEALIFANALPVKKEAIIAVWQAQELGYLSEKFSFLMERLSASYHERAIELCFIAGGWQFRTKEEFAPALKKTIEKPRRLGRGAMESLAIIAYHQPCTRAEIEAIRGVNLGQSVLDNLLEEGLITPKGRKEVPGRPVLWGTTSLFLRSFGLGGLSDLPRREELVQELDDNIEGVDAGEDAPLSPS